MAQKLRYDPDYAVPPGWLVQEIIEERKWSMRTLAQQCDRSPKLISEIISGKASIASDTALQFERVLNVDARIWVNMEASYQLALARLRETEELTNHIEWASRFPVNELKQRGLIDKECRGPDLVSAMLTFFGIGTQRAWHHHYCSDVAAIAFRHSPTFKSSPEALSSWVRIGEISANKLPCAEYNEQKFKDALGEIRGLTTSDPSHFLPVMKKLCADAGVIFLLIKPFTGIKVSGIARWASPTKAIIQQSLRHKTNDHFWFTFFHEAAHILIHSKKDVFVDTDGQVSDSLETEANEWAANFLVPKKSLEVFCKSFGGSALEIRMFSRDIGISPGIAVGQLQKRGVLNWSNMNNLKTRYVWK
jgi:HTH-type transcriptional regulator/antitoxin HigA